MKYLKLFALLLVCVTINTRTQVNALWCYECQGDECDDLTDDFLVECTLDDDSTDSNTALPTTTTVNPTDSTITATTDVTTSTGITATTEASTTAPETTTTPPEITTTTAATEITTTTTPEITTTTAGPEITTPTAEPEITTTTAATEITTTTAEPEITTTTAATEITTTTAATEITTTTAEPEITTTPTTAPEITTTTTTATEITTTATTTEIPTTTAASSNQVRLTQGQRAAAFLVRNYRSISRKRRATDISSVCYSISIKNTESNESIPKRGCVAVSTDESACTAALTVVPMGYTLEDCEACVTDKCNSSGTLKLSMAAFLIVLIVKVFM